MADGVTAVVTGTGSYLPRDTIDNFQLYEMGTLRESFDVEQARAALREAEDVATLSGPAVFDRWARQVTGIETRRHLSRERGLTTEDMCAGAGLAALEDAGLRPSDIDILFVASLTASEEVPNAACTVAEKLGAPRLAGYSLNAACAGFVYGIGAGWSAIVSGMAERALVVAGDALTRLINYTDVRTAVVFADGAGAAVLERSADMSRGVLGPPAVSGEYARDPLHMVGHAWNDSSEPPILHMEGGPSILRNAITQMAAIGEKALAKAGLRWADVDFVVPHQANMRITRGLEKRLKSQLGKGRVVHNISRYGNMSASTVAIALDEVVRGVHGPVPDPATVLVTSIGGGYTMAAAAIRV